MADSTPQIHAPSNSIGGRPPVPTRDDAPRRPRNERREPTEEKEPHERARRVVKTKVTQRKKPWYKKFSMYFTGDETRNVGDYLMRDIFVPAIQNTIVELVRGGVEMLMYGERQYRGKGRGQFNQGNHTSYGGYYNDRGRSSRSISERGRQTHNIEEIIIDYRGEAEMATDELIFLIEDRGYATVADLYDICGISSKYTDRQYGWENDRGIRAPKRLRDGRYVLDIAAPQFLGGGRV